MKTFRGHSAETLPHDPLPHGRELPGHTIPNIATKTTMSALWKETQ